MAEDGHATWQQAHAKHTTQRRNQMQQSRLHTITIYICIHLYVGEDALEEEIGGSGSSQRSQTQIHVHPLQMCLRLHRSTYYETCMYMVHQYRVDVWSACLRWGRSCDCFSCQRCHQPLSSSPGDAMLALANAVSFLMRYLIMG